MRLVIVACLAAAVFATHQSDEVAVKSIPHRDTEWYSLTVNPTDTDTAEFYNVDFDASSFIPTAAPYGLPDPQNRWECPHNRLANIAPISRNIWPQGKDLLLRRLMDLPSGVSALEIRITAFQAVAVYLNGQPVSGSGTPKVTPGGLCAATDNLVFTVPDRFIRTGPNLLAVRVFSTDGLNFFDAQVQAFYPRPVGYVGNVYVWGKGYYGVLGNGYETDSFTPGRILDLKELKTDPIHDLSLGVAHTLMLTESGKVYAWGRGKEGQLGLSEEYSEIPLSVPSANALGVIQAIASGSLHNLLLDNSGRVFCFGSSSRGQCGQGAATSDTPLALPIQVPIQAAVAFIGAKDTHSAAVTTSGQVYVWGRGSKTPRAVGTVAGVKDLAVGSHHLLILTASGQVLSYGLGKEGQLGLVGTTQADSPTPIASLQGVKIVQIAAGSDNSFAVSDSGKVFVFGAGSFGKNGLGVWASQKTPVEISKLGNYVIRRVAPGMTATLFLTDQGQVFMSGADLRDGTHTLEPRFWASASDKYFADVYASHLHFAALTRPSVWRWTKQDNYYQGTMLPDSEIAA